MSTTGDDLALRIARAGRLKSDAQSEKRRGNHEHGLELLQEAASLLTDAVASVTPGDTVGENQREAARELADIYGIRGGILRSQGRWGLAVDAYDSAYDLERKPQFHIETSYGLVQRLLLRVLEDPSRLVAERWQDGDVRYPESFAEADEAVRQQILRGGRANDPWAIADQGMLALLLLRPREVESESWQRLERSTAPSFVFTSTAQTLATLSERIVAAIGAPRVGRVAEVEERARAAKERLDRAAGEES